jgi:hypothetical protein
LALCSVFGDDSEVNKAAVSVSVAGIVQYMGHYMERMVQIHRCSFAKSQMVFICGGASE